MAEITTIPAGVRSRCEPATEARDARRMIGLERHYHCTACGYARRSWRRLPACPDCGEAFVSTVIRRAAFAA